MFLPHLQVLDGKLGDLSHAGLTGKHLLEVSHRPALQQNPRHYLDLTPCPPNIRHPPCHPASGYEYMWQPPRLSFGSYTSPWSMS